MAAIKKSTSAELEKTAAVFIWILLIGLPVSFLIEFFLRCYYPKTEEAFEIIFGFADILTYFIGLVFLIILFMYKSKPENIRLHSQSLLILPWIISIILSVVTAQSVETAVIGILWTKEGAIIFLIYLLLFYLVSIQSEKLRFKTMIVLWIVFGMQFLASVMQSCLKISLFKDYFETFKTTSFSALGLMYNQNALGSFAAIFTGFASGAFLFSKTKKNRSIWLSATALAFFVLTLSGTRGAMLGVAGMLFVIFCYFLITEKTNKKGVIKQFLFLAAAIGLAVLVAALTSDTVRYMFLRVSNDVTELTSENVDVDNLGSQRIMVWKGAIKDFLEHPLLGKGISNFRYLKVSIEKVGENYVTTIFDAFVAHNYYLELLANQGIFGLISYLFMMIGSLVLAFRSLKNASEKEKKMTFACICGVMAFMFTDFFEWHIIYLTPYVYVLLGLMLPVKKNSEIREEEMLKKETQKE